jgi:hypothetical protein
MSTGFSTCDPERGGHCYNPFAIEDTRYSPDDDCMYVTYECKACGQMFELKHVPQKGARAIKEPDSLFDLLKDILIDFTSTRKRMRYASNREEKHGTDPIRYDIRGRSR